MPKALGCLLGKSQFFCLTQGVQDKMLLFLAVKISFRFTIQKNTVSLF